MIKYLLGKASTGKFRYAVVECDEEWHEPEHGYIIQRSYGQVRGKNTLSPAIIVDKTKQKRNWQEQYTLQYNSEVKKFLDKGYVEVEKHPNEYSEEELNEIFGEVKTNQFGVIKPMLAKQSEKVTNTKIFEKEWLARAINEKYNLENINLNIKAKEKIAEFREKRKNFHNSKENHTIFFPRFLLWHHEFHYKV